MGGISRNMVEARLSIAFIAGTLLVVMALVAVMNTETNSASLQDTASTELSNDQGGTSTNGRVDLNIEGCAGFNCQRRFICIDKWKRCTDNWCTVNCNHGPSFCPPTYCRGTPAAPAPTDAPTDVPIPTPNAVVPTPSCIWTEVLMPHQKCAFTTGDHGITKEECQAEADAKKDAFYSWKKIDEPSEAVTNQCFTTATCVGALSNTANGWEVNYCTPADVANDKMCVTTSRGLACCSASCGTCSEDQCTDAPGGKDAC